MALNISASVLSGANPLSVTFTSNIVATIIKYWWSFGDGIYSSEENPVHVYRMPGTYTVSLTVTKSDHTTETETKTDYITVFDWAYGGGDDLHVQCTNRCLRIALKANQGVGWSFYGGADWLWPEARHASERIFNEYDKPITLIWDARTGLPYYMDEETYTDKAGDYEGTEITGEILFKEDRGAYEHYNVATLENHISLRPEDESNKGVSGYSSEGFRNALAVGLSVLKDGNDTPSATTSDIPLDGDIVYDRYIEAHRLQLKFAATASEWQLTRRTTWLKAMDKQAPPIKLQMTEHSYQEELMADMLIWLSRGRNLLMNRTTGTVVSGSYLNATTGADSKTKSAMLFNGDPTHKAYNAISALTGDFTLMAWVSLCTAADIMKFSTGGAIMRIVGSTTFRFYDGVANHDYTFSWSSGSWKHFAIVRSGLNLKMYINGVLVKTDLAGLTAYGGIWTAMDAAIAAAEDVRVFNKAISDGAILYQYTDVTENSGNAVMPIW